jgi:hypothetical protein
MVGLVLWMIGIVSPETLMLIMQSDFKYVVLVLLVLDLTRIVMEWEGKNEYWRRR